jgi:hypothetical protein
MDFRALVAAFSLCIQILAGVAPTKWPQHAWIADIIFWGACALAIACLIWWFFANFKLTKPWQPRSREKKSESNLYRALARMPLLELRDLAVGQGWQFRGPHTLDGPDLLEGLRQTALDGRISVWGRPSRNEFTDLNKTEPLVAIPPDHWRDFNIDWHSVIVGETNFDTRTENPRDSSTPIHRRGCFIDLHVDREIAVAWLKEEAPAYKGSVERAHA